MAAALAGYLVAVVLLGLSLVLRVSRLGTAAAVLTLAGAVLHASWVGPWFVADPASDHDAASSSSRPPIKVRSRRRVRASSRETCIWLVPIRSAMSDCDRSS